MTTVNVTSELFNAGFTPDGLAYIGEVFFVDVEFDDGVIWRHQTSFNGVDSGMDDEGYYYVDVNERAEQRALALAQKVRNRLANGGELCITHWDVVPTSLPDISAIKVDDQAWFNETIRQVA